MIDRYVAARGPVVAGGTLRIRRAAAIAALLRDGAFEYVRLVECRCPAVPASSETVVIDVDVQRGQDVVHEIGYDERLALTFGQADDWYPDVRALRADFPLVPHTNLLRERYPRSLCLFDRPWEEVKLTLTAAGLLDAVREWLRLTARGELHAADQPLEPLLAAGYGPLILPPGSREAGDGTEPLVVEAAEWAQGQWIVRADQAAGVHDRSRPIYMYTTIEAPQQQHSVIAFQPATLVELHDLLSPGGLDLLGELRRRIANWKSRRALAARLAIVLRLPKTREVGGPVEQTETWAFFSVVSVEEIGDALGVYEPRRPGPIRHPVSPPDSTKRGDTVKLIPLNPVEPFTPELAASLDGHATEEPMRIVAIGVGAIGSQVFGNLARIGWGRWTLIDKDLLLPHNLARHELDSAAVGQAKAVAMARWATELLADEDFARPIVADILRSAGYETAIKDARAAADLILDMSASVPVARHLSEDVAAPARRLSLFLNPGGTDLVLLGEDSAHLIPLDIVEMQYYRCLIRDDRLSGHLDRVGSVRYANSCRDVTATIPQHQVAMHAAIGSAAVRRAATDEAAAIFIWRSNPGTGEVVRIAEPPAPMFEHRAGHWTIRTDQALLGEIAGTRVGSLPNETGGVLLGSVDVARRIIYIVETLAAPPDSIEEPDGFVRGCERLQLRIGEVEAATAGMVRYAGDWHSHPRGSSTRPSPSDVRLLDWLRDNVAREGVPPVMLIVGDDGTCNWIIGTDISTTGGRDAD